MVFQGLVFLLVPPAEESGLKECVINQVLPLEKGELEGGMNPSNIPLLRGGYFPHPLG